MSYHLVADCVAVLVLLVFIFCSDALEIESFISSDEFVEKTLEEFFRCDTTRSGSLDATQLLLAALHLEQDLRPLLPPQAAKHRQPQMADVEIILQTFGGSDRAAKQPSHSKVAAAPQPPPQSLNHFEFLHFVRPLAHGCRSWSSVR